MTAVDQTSCLATASVTIDGRPEEVRMHFSNE